MGPNEVCVTWLLIGSLSLFVDWTVYVMLNNFKSFDSDTPPASVDYKQREVFSSAGRRYILLSPGAKCPCIAA